MSTPTTQSKDILIDNKQAVSKLLQYCIGFEVLLVILDLILVYNGGLDSKSARRIFGLAQEDSIGTWFSVSQALFVGLTVWLIFFLDKGSKTSIWNRGGWFLIASFFTYISIDDGAKIHERLASSLRGQFDFLEDLLSFFPSYSWQITFLPLFALFGVYMVIFLWKKMRMRWQIQSVFFALTFFVIAIALDFIDGMGEDVMIQIADWIGIGDRNLLELSRVVEETFEMMGTSLFWAAFFGQLLTKVSTIRIETPQQGTFTLRFSNDSFGTTLASEEDEKVDSATQSSEEEIE